MHIQNMTIHVSYPPGFAREVLAELSALDKVPTAAPALPPAIGEVWPGQGGVYAGLSRGEDGEPDAHLVLLTAVAESWLNWADAVAWAQAQGDGARLPTRFESALLYANLSDQMEINHWHWTGTQYSDDYAWGQNFGGGFQDYDDKGAVGRVRAVRRFTA